MTTRMPTEVKIASFMVLKAKGEIDLSNCEEIGNKFICFFSQGVSNWLIDMREVTYFDSEGLKVLLKCIESTREREGRVAIICNEKGFVDRVFDICQMDSIIKCHHDIMSALQFINL